jgi:hypothetical protein
MNGDFPNSFSRFKFPAQISTSQEVQSTHRSADATQIFEPQEAIPDVDLRFGLFGPENERTVQFRVREICT